jgi:hypothetical protein
VSVISQGTAKLCGVFNNFARDKFLKQEETNSCFSVTYSAVSIVTGYGLDSRGRSSSPGWDKVFLIFTSSRPVLGPTQPPIQWIPRALSSGVKHPGLDQEYMDLYIHSYIRLYGVVLN